MKVQLKNKIPKDVKLKKFLVSLLLTVIIISSIFNYVLSQKHVSIVNEGYAGVSYFTTASWIISKDETFTYAQSGDLRTVYESTKAGYIMELIIGELTNGGMIFIRAGTYLFDTSIVMKSDIVLVGEGYDKTILKLADNVNDSLIKIGDGTNTIARVEILELTLDGNKDNNNAGHGIHVQTTALCRLLVKNIYVQYFKEHGIFLESGGGAIIDSIRVINCDKNGLKVKSSDHLFTNIVVAKSGLSCISLEGEHSHLTSFHVWGGGQLGSTCQDQCGVCISGRKYTVVSGESEHNKRVGVCIDQTTVGKNQIIGVICWGNGLDDSGCTGRGISLLDTKYNTIMGCSCYDTRSPAYQDYGIQEYGTADYNTIVNNDVCNNTDAPIAWLGSHTIVKNNIGYVTENSGTATNLANGGTVVHGLAGTPTTVSLTCLNATYDGKLVLVYWDQENTDGSNISVDIYWVNGTAITTGGIDVSWSAEYKP